MMQAAINKRPEADTVAAGQGPSKTVCKSALASFSGWCLFAHTLSPWLDSKASESAATQQIRINVFGGASTDMSEAPRQRPLCVQNMTTKPQATLPARCRMVM